MKILRSGLLTTVQDCGRWGFQARGVPVCGAMDLYSHRLANRLVGNEPAAATLEITLTGPEIEFAAPAVIAVAGAQFSLTLDGSPLAMNAAADVRPGSCLRFGERMRGARAYLAVSGGIQVPDVLNSRSTHLLTGMGGYLGRALRAGDILPIAKKGYGPFLSQPEKRAVPLFLPDGGARLRVLAGPHTEMPNGERFRVSPRSNRMGYQLDGPSISRRAAAELLSSAVPIGAIQVPPSGQPILLMADHATTGGYPIVAVVITADLPLAGQLAPGDWVEFELCSPEVADEAHRAQEGWQGGSSL